MERFVQSKEDAKYEIENTYDSDDYDDENDNGDTGEATGPANGTNKFKSEETTIQRRKSILISRDNTVQLKSKGQTNPIYGVGVVFYLDHYGRIQGIMTWGLPFADRPGEGINPELLDCIKHLIQTNAGVSAQDAENNHQLMNTVLGRASQKLVALAVKGHLTRMTRAWHGLDGPIEEFSTPLYRYTEVSSSKNKTVNVLKRKDGSGLGVLGEGLYVRDDFIEVEEARSESNMNTEGDDNQEEEEQQQLPNNIPITNYPIKIHPSYNSEDSKPISAEAAKELNRYLAVQSWWEANENRARPGKEDPLWLRPGEEKKNTSGKQMLNDAYRRIMFAHRSE